MSYLPDFSEKNDVFVEGVMQSNAAHVTRVRRKPAKSGLSDRLLPTDGRAEVISRDKIFITIDEDLEEWERQTRAYLYLLAKGRKHSTSAALIWEWATGLSVAEEYRKGNSKIYNRDLRRINTILRSYFGDPYATFIDGRKFPRAYRISQWFNVDRKAPFCASLMLLWKDGVKIR